MRPYTIAAFCHCERSVAISQAGCFVAALLAMTHDAASHIGVFEGGRRGETFCEKLPPGKLSRSSLIDLASPPAMQVRLRLVVVVFFTFIESGIFLEFRVSSRSVSISQKRLLQRKVDKSTMSCALGIGGSGFSGEQVRSSANTSETDKTRTANPLREEATQKGCCSGPHSIREFPGYCLRPATRHIPCNSLVEPLGYAPPLKRTWCKDW